MKQYQKVQATFRPKRTDDLQNNAAAYVGRSGQFMAAWLIDSGPYAGEWAMQTPPGWEPAWVPLCDLEIDCNVSATS